MELIVIGVNHKTAPIEIRERLAFQEDKIEEALCQAKSLPSLKEGMILSTCNRVEIYAAARETDKAIHHLRDFFSQYHGLSLKEFEKNLYLLVGEEAVRSPYTSQEIEQMKKKASQYLTEAGAALRVKGATTSVRVEVGNAAEEILKVADELKVDMIAMSSHGRSGLSRLAFGSVTDKVLHGSNRPVLVVRAPKGLEN